MFGIDLTLTLARLLAWGTLGLVALMVLFLLVLRWVRSYRAPRLASFESQWLPRLMACALGDEVVPIPLARWQRWHFMKLWLRAQMSLQGVSRERLAAFGRAMGCSSMALQRAHSPHQSERMVGMLALGFLGEVQYVPLLLKRLVSERAQQSVYAGRALLEIDEQAHADKVVQALLTTPGLEMSLTSIVFRPFRARMADVLLRKPPHPSEAESLRWLRLASALQSQIPTVVLIPFLQQDEDIECLIAAIRLVQGEQGGALVAAQAQHKDWRVRGQVARALGFIGGSEELHVLRQLLTDETWWVRYRAAQSLLRLPAMNAERLLEIAHITQDRYALSMAQAVIAEVGGGA